ncbi:hypothetical protein CHARACLAT_007936 [Characodon lateralis]|uniref:NTR domain-containing protein n=1 Tax=Characodon lateralis TaxID=208331 RepID=A0ABU7CY25_9TELE|nr:hypothetical protein [Characodon lateralis]
MKTVSDTQAEKISFKIQQMLAHHALQPAAVSVYDFHNKKRCVKFYHPEREKGVLFILSQNNKRICAEENCSKQIKGKMSTDDRFTKSCESTPTSKIEYVYKVAVENFSEISPTDIYTMRILQIIKEGYNVVSPPGTLRSFLSHQRCKSSLDLKTNQTYLIMGKSPDASMDNYSQQFIMDENTWVEYWPTMKECQTERYRPTCIRAWRNSKT